MLHGPMESLASVVALARFVIARIWGSSHVYIPWEPLRVL